jgi:DNA-binding transcriptional ArsR family regulator
MSRPVASADIFQAIADPTRRAILDRLREGEQPVKQLAEPFEMLELEEPNRLVYTWQEHSTCEPSLVIWTLTAVEGGTQLQLKHREYSYTAAIPPLSSRKAMQTDRKAGLFRSEMIPTSPGWETDSFASNLHRRIQSGSLGAVFTLEVPAPESFEWEYYLNQKLPDVLARC